MFFQGQWLFNFSDIDFVIIGLSVDNVKTLLSNLRRIFSMEKIGESFQIISSARVNYFIKFRYPF